MREHGFCFFLPKVENYTMTQVKYNQDLTNHLRV